MPAINTKPNNDRQFDECRKLLIDECSPGELKESLTRLKPTPAQIFRVTEITLLADSSLETKHDLLQKIGEYVAQSLSEVLVLSETVLMMINAYRDAVKMVSFSQDEIESIMKITKGNNGISAEEIKAYLFAKHQDCVRYIIARKGLEVENREPYNDPAPQSLERTREDFLAGKGAFIPEK